MTKEERKEYSHKYYITHQEEIKLRTKEFQKTTEFKEKNKIYHKKYIDKNKEKNIQYQKEQNQKWYKNHKEKSREYCKNNRKKEKEKFNSLSLEEKIIYKQKKKEQHKKEYNKAILKHGKELINEKKFVERIKRIYKLSFEDYNKLFKSQNKVCAICKQQEIVKNSLGEIKRLNVDHNHITGKIRGLLCHNCNIALGNFKDNKQNLESAITYLDKYK